MGRSVVLTSPDQAAAVYVGAFVDEIARAGVRHVCIAPGSRSTPLALMIARHPALRTWMHLDERSAAFFALGMARALGKPVALLCTSGTAAANFLPAVVEARSARVPLIVLTADRPPELRDVGAAQTIDQHRLYGSYPKWFVEVALPDTAPELLRYARTLACRAAATAMAVPAGPVHLNFPFREPLVPAAIDPPSGISSADLLAWHGRPNGVPWVTVDEITGAASPETIQHVAAHLTGARRPLVVCGPQFDRDLAEPLSALARAIGAPVLVDPLSQLRWGTHDRCTLIDGYDALLRNASLASSLVPDVVLRIGGIPTSKTLLQYLERHASATQILVDAQWPDPTLVATRVVHAEPRRFCMQLLAHIAGETDARAAGTNWLASWRQLDAATGAALAAFTESIAEPFEGAALAQIMASMPADGTVFVSSSMPVRDLDSFARGDGRPLRILANRGANGIDGVISSALGVAATRESGDGPVVLVVGDLAFYHDMNGLLAARMHSLDVTIVVINNDGGGIFSFLPQAADSTRFEQLFGTPHGMQFEPVAALYGASYRAAGSIDELRAAVTDGIRGTGLHIVELRTDRARNVALHRDAWARVAAAVDALEPAAE